MKKTKYRYQWMCGYLKRTEGGIGVQTAKDVLKKMENIRVSSMPSPYIGSTVLIIDGIKKSDITKALRKIKDYGYIEHGDMANEINNIRKIC